MGYKAKQGVILIRTRVRRGGLKGKPHERKRPRPVSPRSRWPRTRSASPKSVSRHFPNLEVLNSYWVGQDGKHKYYEVIMIDTHHPAIINDKQLGVFSRANGKRAHRGRAYRGKTSAGKRGRGLHNKGQGRR